MAETVEDSFLKFFEKIVQCQYEVTNSIKVYLFMVTESDVSNHGTPRMDQILAVCHLYPFGQA